MITTTYSVPPSLEEEEGTLPCLLVSTDDNSFPPSPTVPRLDPLIQLTGPLEAISVEELLSAQAGDTWCQDMLTFMDETAGFRSTLEIRWDRNGVLSCLSPLGEDAPLRWLVPASLRERVLTH